MARHTGKKTQPLKTLSIKVPQALSARVARLAAERSTTVSSVVREALAQYDQLMADSFGEMAKRYIGSISGGPGDLATNSKHMEGFGE